MTENNQSDHYTTTHDLMAPATIIKGFADLLLDNDIIQSHPQLQQDVLTIKDQADLLMERIKALRKK